MEAAPQETLLRKEVIRLHGELRAEKEGRAADIGRMSKEIGSLRAEVIGIRIACALRTADYDYVCAERDAYAARVAEIESGGGGGGGEGRQYAALKADHEALQAEHAMTCDTLKRTEAVLWTHENPNSPSASRSLYYVTRNKVRRKIGSTSDTRIPEGGGGSKGRGRDAAGRGRDRDAAGRGGREEEEEVSSRRGGTEKSEASFLVPLPHLSSCCDRPIEKSTQTVRERHSDLVGPWMFDVIAVDERGERLQGLARDADRAGGPGRACHCTILRETGECTGCGRRVVARSYVSIPGTRAGAILRKIVNDLAQFMSHEDIALYLFHHHGFYISANGVAAVLRASARSVRPYERRILAYIVGVGYAIVDETTVRALGEWGYAVVAHAPRAAWIRYTRSKSAAELARVLGPLWDMPMVTDEARMYPNGMRQTCHVHLGRQAEEPVAVWLALFGDKGAGAAGIDPRREMADVSRHVLGPLIALIRAEPGVELREGAAMPSLEPLPELPERLAPAAAAVAAAAAAAAGAGRDIPAAPTASTLLGIGRRTKRLPGRRKSLPGGGEMPREGEEGERGPPSPSQIAAYRRDATPYYALPTVVGLLKLIDIAPSNISIAFQRTICMILGWYGEGHPVRARYENAMPRRLAALQVRGMPFDANPCEAAIKNFAMGLRRVFRQFKSEEAMENKPARSTFTASARLGGLPPGRAMACVQQYPVWDMSDPDRAPPPRPGRCRHAYPAGAA